MAGLGVFEALFTAKDGMTGPLKTMTSGLAGMTTQGLAMGAAFAAMNIGITAAIGAIQGLGQYISDSIDLYLRFEKGLSEVATLLSDTSVIDSYKQSLLDLSTASGQSLDTLTEGLYQVISASIEAENAMHVLTVATALATGGMSDTATTVDLLTSIINAYGMSATNAGRVSDILFETVRLGKTTISELGASLGTVTSLAAAMGVSLEEVNSALVVMTRGGIQTTNAVTYLRAILNSILKPTESAKKAAAELGIEFNAAALQAKGLVPFLTEVAEKTEGNSDAFAKLFPNIRATTGVTALLKDGGEELNIVLEDVTDSANATEDALAKVMETDAFKMEQMSAVLEAQQVELGEATVGWKLWFEEVKIGFAEIINAVGTFPQTIQENIGGPVGDVLAGASDAFTKGIFPIYGFLDAIGNLGAEVADTDGKMQEFTEALAVQYDEMGNVETAMGNLDYLQLSSDLSEMSMATWESIDATTIFDTELQNAVIACQNLAAEIQILKDENAAYALDMQKNNLEIMKIRFEADSQGRELTDKEKARIAELKLANDELRINKLENNIAITESNNELTENATVKVQERIDAMEIEKQAFDAFTQFLVGGTETMTAEQLAILQTHYGLSLEELNNYTGIYEGDFDTFSASMVSLATQMGIDINAAEAASYTQRLIDLGVFFTTSEGEILVNGPVLVAAFQNGYITPTELLLATLASIGETAVTDMNTSMEGAVPDGSNFQLILGKAYDTPLGKVLTTIASKVSGFKWPKFPEPPCIPVPVSCKEGSGTPGDMSNVKSTIDTWEKNNPDDAKSKSSSKSKTKSAQDILDTYFKGSKNNTKKVTTPGPMGGLELLAGGGIFGAYYGGLYNWGNMMQAGTNIFRMGSSFTTRPVIGMVGEAGPEAVIPMSGPNRYRGANILREILPIFPEVMRDVVKDAARFGNAPAGVTETGERSSLRYPHMGHNGPPNEWPGGASYGGWNPWMYQGYDPSRFNFARGHNGPQFNGPIHVHGVQNYDEFMREMQQRSRCAGARQL